MTGKRFAIDWEPDDPEGVDVVVPDDGGGPAFLPAAARNLDPDIRHVLADMQRQAFAIAEMEADLARSTDTLRRCGVSWAVLGFVQGLTGEALRRRAASAGQEDES